MKRGVQFACLRFPVDICSNLRAIWLGQAVLELEFCPKYIWSLESLGLPPETCRSIIYPTGARVRPRITGDVGIHANSCIVIFILSIADLVNDT